MRIEIPCIDRAFILHHFRHLCGLAAGCRAHVEDRLPRFRREDFRRHHGRSRLHIGEPFFQECAKETIRAALDGEAFRQIGDGRGFDPFFREESLEVSHRLLQRIHTDGHRRDFIESREDRICFFHAPCVLPVFDEPARLVVGERIMEERIFFPRRELEAVFFTKEIPKDAVHEADIARMSHFLSNLDRFIHRRRRGDARQKEQLIEGKTKKNPHGRMQLFHLLRRKLPDDPE